MAEKETESRLTALEVRVSEMQRSLDELGEMTRQQWAAIERLQGEVKVLGHEILAETEGERSP